MPNESHNPTPDEWRDRLVDRALAEHLGGETPPDLSEQILAAAGETSSSTGDLTMATTPANTNMGLRGWVLAASLLVNCGLLAMLFATRPEQPRLTQTARHSEQSHPQPTAETVGPVKPTDVNQQEGKPQDEFYDALDRRQVTTDAYEIAPTDGPQPTADDGLGFDNKLDLVISQTHEVEESGDGQQAGGQAVDRLAARNEKLGLDPAVVYPDAEVWEDMTSRRDKIAKAAPATPANGRPMPARYRREAESLNRYPRAKLMISDGSGRQGGQQGMTYDTDADSFYTLSPTQGEGPAKWGFQGGRGQWPRGEAQPWEGSPDGRGIGPGASGDQYERIHENPFVEAIGGEAVSTFSIDVDTASYANIRQMLTNGQVPPADAVRIEELVNYFTYNYDSPTPNPSPEDRGGEQMVPFAAHVETAGCPWAAEHRLVRIGIKGRELPADKRPQSNLVFLVDVSGSMQNPDKLPLVKHGLKQLAGQLGENDRVAIVVYASQEGLALPSTTGDKQETIIAALDNLEAGGSTAGGAGITLAYQIAEDNFIQGGTNRVVLCTDGDFNVGTTSTAELERMVEQKAKDTKVFLSCIGFGRGNLNDAMMEKITGIGNGNYYYADDDREAERIFVKGMTGMLVTIAKDVKIQVEFNPAKVAGYRLLGYENRMLRTQDFNDDKKDAGEIGAGHTVTCLYEIVPAGESVESVDVDDLKYQRPAGLTDAADADELLTLKMRYKEPDEDTSSKLEWPIADSGHRFGQATTDMQFAASVASFGMLLRDSQYRGDANWDAVLEIAQSAKGDDPDGERQEFVELVRAAKRLKPMPAEAEEAPGDAAAESAPAE